MSNNNLWKKIGIGATITGGVIAGVALLPMTLGFGTAGIVGGSVAAGIQAAIGNVAAGSLFAVCTSLGMSGVFASTAVVGAILGAGGLAAYIKGNFQAPNDAELIHEIITNRDNPDLIIELLRARFPFQREEIRQQYNQKYPNNNFDNDIINYIPIDQRTHIENLLRNTSDIMAHTEIIRTFLNNQTFDHYFNNEFNFSLDAILIDNIINNNDNPLMIVRLLNYRNEEQRRQIDHQFREIKADGNRRMIEYIVEFMPDHPDIDYVNILLHDI